MCIFTVMVLYTVPAAASRVSSVNSTNANFESPIETDKALLKM